MSSENRPWTERFRPRTISEVVDNEEAVKKLLSWVRSWRTGVPERRSVILYGPPGTGKNSAVEAIANDLGFDLMEVNASDYRTAARLEEVLGRTMGQTQTLFGKRRMILFDELEGISGQDDRGGVEAILRIIKDTRSPIVMIATGAPESWGDLLNPLVKVSTPIEFRHVPFKSVVQLLRRICNSLSIEADEEALELIAQRSNGDLRSAINDLEVSARGKVALALEDTYWLGDRDRKNELTKVINGIFSARSFRDARESLDSSPINYEELFEWIYENLPYFYDDPQDLSEAMEALSRADAYRRRVDETQEYRLLKYMLDEMTGGVALARQRSTGTGLMEEARKTALRLGLPASTLFVQEEREGIVVKPTRFLGNDWQSLNNLLRGLGARWLREKGVWVIPYLRPPGRISHLAASWWSRRRVADLSEKVAARCHISKKAALTEVIPYIKAIFQENSKLGAALVECLDLEEETTKWLRGR